MALLLAIPALVFTPSAQADDPSIPDLIYKVATGEVILDPTDGGSIIGYELISGGSFIPGNFTGVLGGVETATTSVLSEATFAGITTPASIGEVFPTWLDAAGLASLLSTRTVSTTLGSPLLDFDLIVQLPGTASNASFSMGSDVNVLNLDFGTVNLGAAVGPLNFCITNFAPVGDTARLDLVSTSGTGDTGVLTTDLAPFTNLLANAAGTCFDAAIDTSSFGTFSSSYDLDFTDILGTNQTLTLNLTGEVDLFDDPANPDLVYFSSTGELFIDPTDSGGIIGYSLQSNDAFNDLNFTPVLSGAVVTSLPGELAEASLTTLTTIESLGTVLPTGLTATELIALFDVRDAATALGSPIVQFDILFGGCLLGDADCDGYIDIAGDILPGFSNFTGPGSFGKTRAQGDVHGPTEATSDPAGHDGDVDVSDLLTMFSNFTGPAPDGSGGLAAAEAADPNIPDLIYNPLTGEVILDVDGSGIIGYVLKNGSNSFVFGNHTQILVGLSTSLSSELSEAAFASSVGANSLGNVFPLGMDLAALTAYLTVNDVSRSLGAPVVPFDLVVLSTGPAVPEPATVLLSVFGLVGLGFIAYRRRRAA